MKTIFNIYQGRPTGSPTFILNLFVGGFIAFTVNLAVLASADQGFQGNTPPSKTVAENVKCADNQGNKPDNQKSDTANWRQLFNGKDLTGWKHVGPGSMSVENGLIRGHGGMGLLYWTGEKFGNCVIRVVFKMELTNSNSGVFIRIPIEPYEEWMPVYYGYEVQIDNQPELSDEDDYHYTGMLYSLTKPLAKPGKPGPEWNTMEITMDGLKTSVVVNGVKVMEYKEGDPVPERKFDFEPFRGPRPETGYIGLQNHGDKDVVFFKEVSVKPLKKALK